MDKHTTSLTQVQEAAIAYALNAKRPNDYRVKRKTTRLVREYCEAQGYNPESTSAAIKDTHDMICLERNAEY